MTTTTFWEGLSEGEQGELTRIGRTKRWYQPGQHLFTQSIRGEEAIVLTSGSCRVVGHNRDGSGSYLGARTKGDIVGEMAMLRSESRTATVVALTPVRVRVLSKSAFASALSQHPGIALNLLRILADRLEEADGFRADLAGAATADVRLSRMLLRVVAAEGTATHAGIVLERVSQRELADWCGMSLASAGRSLRKLQERRILDEVRKRERIVVCDMPALRDHAFPP
ncbi:Crp/Fnr family transcriptional regulator [Streptomyces apocyni]|uniref:Crp/Fnr family transcriptional regulator n=1 Tax=Streptomyces apocyni TaxID=2654677 RepID=UPI0012EA0F5E|nr:Crp/Fnr family transcriptional regulator [Streptomyces apocyni]